MLRPALPAQSGRTPACRVRQRDDALLDTAKQLFLDRGFAQVSIELIARSAGVAARTIYVHFGDKHGLLSKVIARERDRADASANKMQANLSSVEESLRCVALQLLSQTLSPETRYLHADALAAREYQMAETIDPVRCSPWRGNLRACFDGAAWFAHLPPAMDADVLCDMFLGCVMGAQSRAMLDAKSSVSNQAAIRILADHLARDFLAACKRQSWIRIPDARGRWRVFDDSIRTSAR